MSRVLFSVLVFASVGSVIAAATATAQSPPAPSSAERPTWTLDAALTAALAQSPVVEAARARMTSAEGARRTAVTLPNPIATYWMENTRFPGQAPFSNLDRELSAYATLPLEPFLQRSSRRARADADVRAARSDVAGAERDLALEVGHAFYRVALAQATVEAMSGNQAAAQQLVDYLAVRVGQGAAPEGEAIRAEVERNRAETEMALADVELLRARAALRPWLAVDDASSLASIRVVVPDAAEGTSPLAPLAVFATRAQADRPELVAMRAKVDSASRAIDVERALMIRQLGATFGVKRTANINAMVAGISVTVPLFDRNRGEVQRATGERLAAEQELRWLERMVSGEVDAAFQASRRLAALVTALRPASLQRAEESQRIAFGAYQEGAATLLQVVDASRALTDARLTYARALVAAGESVFELGLATGYDAKAAARLGQGAQAEAAPQGGSR